MALIPQPVPWVVLSSREIGDAAGNTVQYTFANLGLICLAVNAHAKLYAALAEVEQWLRADPAKRKNEDELLRSVVGAMGRTGAVQLASEVENAVAGNSNLDLQISLELQIPNVPYTSSLENALALVPAGWRFGFETHNILDPEANVTKSVSAVTLVAPDGRSVNASSAMLPLAICAASLRALEA